MQRAGKVVIVGGGSNAWTPNIVKDMLLAPEIRCSREEALQALRLDRVCSHLNTMQVREMGEKLMRAHSKYLPEFD